MSSASPTFTIWRSIEMYYNQVESAQSAPLQCQDVVELRKSYEGRELYHCSMGVTTGSVIQFK